MVHCGPPTVRRSSRGFDKRDVEGPQECVTAASSPLEVERTLSDTERTLADSDQTLSDADQTSCDRDHTSAGCDQLAADRDQAASDRDVASGAETHDITEGIRVPRRAESAQRPTTSTSNQRVASRTAPAIDTA